MKATDLMIGDWVVCSDPHPFKITSIEFDDPYYVVCGDDGFPVDLGDLKPITLTEDILKANGFEENYWHAWMIAKGLHCIIEKKSEQNSILPTIMDSVCYRCHYVHELQHALRICGLNDLADNFKLYNV